MKIKSGVKIKSKRAQKKLRWGVAGLGRFSENTLIPTILRLKRSSLTSVYSSSIERAKEISNKFIIPIYSNDYSEFLKSDFDILYVGSANHNHHWQVIEAAKAGKHILCEKPLALNSEQAKEMVDACKTNNVFFTVNYVHRYHPLSVKAKEFINKSLIGSIVSVSASFNIDYEPNENFRFNISQSGGGALRDLGTHMIDVLRFFGGEIEDIKGYVDNVIYKSEVDDFATAVVKFNKGGYGNFNVSFNSKKAFNRIDIVGSHGTLSIENIIGSKKKPGKLSIDLIGEAKKAFIKRADKQTYALKSIQRSILNNKQPLISGYDGLVNMELMEKLENQ